MKDDIVMSASSVEAGAKPNTSDARLLFAVKCWAQARADRLAEKHAMEAYRCELAERGEPETGYQGVAPCFCASGPIDEWCAACQARDPHFRKMVLLKSIERRYLRGLCSLLARRELSKQKAASHV